VASVATDGNRDLPTRRPALFMDSDVDTPDALHSEERGIGATANDD